MTDKIRSPMPTVEEILAGKTQGGVPKPAFSFAPASSETKATRWAAFKARMRSIFTGG